MRIFLFVVSPTKQNKRERQRWIDVVKEINADLVVGDNNDIFIVCHWPKPCRVLLHSFHFYKKKI